MSPAHLKHYDMHASELTSQHDATAAPPVCVVLAEPADDSSLTQQANALARTLHWPCLAGGASEDGMTDATSAELQLVVTSRRYELRWAEPSEQTKIQSRKKSRKPAKADSGHAIFADWSSLNIASSAGTSLKQPIAKALGLKPHQDPPLRVIDATAGWGEDAWVMASLGCHVLMVERSPVVAVMLQDALNRERSRSPQTVARLRVVHADATDLLNQLGQGESLFNQHHEALSGSVWETQPGVDQGSHAAADVIHLDPMFPGQKTSAERKPMRLLRRLVGNDGDALALWQAAMTTGVKRVVVKRPPHGASLGASPEAVIKGKASRYDVHVVHR